MEPTNQDIIMGDDSAIQSSQPMARRTGQNHRGTQRARADYNHRSYPTTQTFDNLVNNLIALIPTENKDKAQSLAKDIQQAYQQATAVSAKTNLTTLPDLRKVVAEEIRVALRETQPSRTTQPTRTWADIARGTTATIPSILNQPAKVIPAKLNREILVKGNDLPPNLSKRNPQEIIQAVNQASSKKGAIAARKLPSGDTVITFTDPTTRDWHSSNNNWIQQAFGNQAKEARRTFAILVKGVYKSDIQGTSETEFGKGLGLKSLEKVKFQYPKDQNLKWVSILVSLTNQAEAKNICDTGAVFKAQIFNCEPYWAPLRPTQCYKCWKWGHTSRYCKKDSLCPRCGTGAHGTGGKEGEAQCHTLTRHLPCKCPACGGRHPAWDKECPERKKAQNTAREAYQHRPRTFEAATPTPTTLASSLTFTNSQGDSHYQTGEQVRKRGRPTYIQQASQDPRQSRLTTLPNPFSQLNPQISFPSTSQPSSQPSSQPDPQPNLQPDSQSTPTL